VPRTIVVAARGEDDPTRDAVALAVLLARALHARVVLAGVVASPLWPGDGLYERAVRTELQQQLELVRETLPQDVASSVQVRGSTSVVRGLHRLAEELDADVLVLGPSHFGTLGRIARGDVALTTLHDAPCAVAVAPHGLRDAASEGPARIVVGFDGSPEARDALEAAVELAAGLGATVQVVHAVETPQQLADHLWVGAPTPEGWAEELRAQGEEALEEARILVGSRAPVETLLAEGVPSQELARAAAGATLAVVGSRRFGALRRLVLGSTSAELLSKAELPVLVLPRAAADPAATPKPVAT